MKRALLLLLLSVLALSPSRSTHAAPMVRIKNARQLYNDITAVLDIRAKPQALKIYQALESNLPEKGLASELTPSLDSVIKLTAGICELFATEVVQDVQRDPARRNEMTPEKAVLNVYQLALDREPTALEAQKIIATIEPGRAPDAGLFDSLISSCLVTTTSLEFLVVSQ